MKGFDVVDLALRLDVLTIADEWQYMNKNQREKRIVEVSITLMVPEETIRERVAALVRQRGTNQP